MNPLNLIGSAIGAFGSALTSPPSNANSSAGSGSEFGLSSGGDVVSGGGSASPSTGISTGTILTFAAVGIGGFFLWKHFAR